MTCRDWRRRRIPIEQLDGEAASELPRRRREIAFGVMFRILKGIELVKSADGVVIDAAEPGLALESLSFFMAVLIDGQSTSVNGYGIPVFPRREKLSSGSCSISFDVLVCLCCP